MDERLFIHYQFVKDKESDTRDIIKEFTKNISAGGLMFEADSPIPAQSIFNLEIYQPLRNSKAEIISIPTLAKVKWIALIDNADEDKDSDRYRMGIEFVGVDIVDRNRIAEYVRGRSNA